MSYELKANSCWLKLSIHHDQLDPELLTAKFGVRPQISSKTRWEATILEGIASTSGLSSDALESVRTLFESQQDFLLKIAADRGKAVLTLAQVTPVIEGLHIQEFLSHIHLEPSFLQVVALSGTALSIEIWDADDNGRNGLIVS